MKLRHSNERDSICGGQEETLRTRNKRFPCNTYVRVII